MKNKRRLSYAIAFAAAAHAGQFRWGGEPYITHPMRVCESLLDQGERIQIVAILHDVLEDCPDVQIKTTEWHNSRLVLNQLQFTITPREYDALLHLTHRKDHGESYEDYIERLSSNDWACIVKLADLRDNMKGLKVGSARFKKYSKARDRLCENTSI